MIEKKQKKTAGRKSGSASTTPQKTEIITVRLDAKTRYGLELLARKQYRTLTSVVDWAINSMLRDEQEGIEFLEEVWDSDEADRLVKLALKAPEFLTYTEHTMWKLIRENGYFWKGRRANGEWQYAVTQYSIAWERVRECWTDIKKIAEGTLPRSALPTLQVEEEEPAF